MHVLVTGGTGGIGTAICKKLADMGHKVATNYRNEEKAREWQARMQSSGYDFGLAKGDVSSPEEAAAMVRDVESTLGPIDILINNVGGTIWTKPFEHYGESEIEAEVRRSLFPTLWCCRAALPYMQEQGKGAIVNVSSIATRGVNRVPYGAAKGGVNALTQSLAMEYAQHNIRVAATAPGGTSAPPRRTPRNAAGDTAQEQAWMAEAIQQVTESTFFKRYGTLNEQVAPILFLASDEAGYITGTVLPVAGGDLG